MRDTYRMFGIPIEAGSRNELHSRIASLIGKGGVVNTVNPEMMKCAVENGELYRALMNSLNIPDGNVLVSAMRKDGVKSDVYPGVELGERILDEKGVRLAIIGGKEGVAEQALRRLSEGRPSLQCAFAENGYSTDERMLDAKINSHLPSVVFVCLGTPRQQLLSYKLNLSCKVE